MTFPYRSRQNLSGEEPQSTPRHGNAGAMKAAAFLAPLALLAVAVAAQLPDAVALDRRAPANMSTLRVEGLGGYPVHDERGVRIGEVTYVETDARGRTRYIRMQLKDGREARLAAFRARLDEGQGRVDLVMPLHAVQHAAGPQPVLTANRAGVPAQQ